MRLGAGALCSWPRGSLAVGKGGATVVWPPTQYLHLGDLHIEHMVCLAMNRQTDHNREMDST